MGLFINPLLWREKARWDAPMNADGSPISGVAGYRIHYGTAPGDYTGYIDVGNVTRYPIADFSSAVPVKGTMYYITVTALDTAGNESAYSNEITKTVD
jgi:hypothetical protein